MIIILFYSVLFLLTLKNNMLLRNKIMTLNQNKFHLYSLDTIIMNNYFTFSIYYNHYRVMWIQIISYGKIFKYHDVKNYSCETHWNNILILNIILTFNFQNIYIT